MFQGALTTGDLEEDTLMILNTLDPQLHKLEANLDHSSKASEASKQRQMPTNVGEDAKRRVVLMGM